MKWRGILVNKKQMNSHTGFLSFRLFALNLIEREKERAVERKD